mgnify:FL=1
MSMISNEDIQNFENDGFLIKKNFFDKTRINEIRNWVYEYMDKQIDDWEFGKEMAYYETSKKDGTRILARIEKFVDYHNGFKNLVESKQVTDCVDALMGESSVFFKEKINFKKAGGGGFNPHQDQISRWETYAKNFMNVLICTDDSTIENGCLEVSPGFHKMGLLGPVDQPIPQTWLEKMNFIPVTTSLGDVIFFDGFTPHQSKDNKSKKPRTNVYLTYNKLSEGIHRESYFTRKRKELPPDNEREENFKDSPLHDYK